MEPAYRARSLSGQQHGRPHHMCFQHRLGHRHTPSSRKVCLAATNPPTEEDLHRVTVRYRRVVSSIAQTTLPPSLPAKIYGY